MKDIKRYPESDSKGKKDEVTESYPGSTFLSTQQFSVFEN